MRFTIKRTTQTIHGERVQTWRVRWKTRVKDNRLTLVITYSTKSIK